MRRILAIRLENQPGALSRVVSMFSARAYNIDSLTVASTEDETLSRMTIVTHGSDDVIEQIIKQINKIVDVASVTDITEQRHVERELLLVKVRAANAEVREEMHRLVAVFRGRINDVTDRSFIIEVTGTGGKLDAFLAALPQTSIKETVRTGVAGVTRGRP
ncbi:MAG: acetolactate synthase small subunit [Betaproteobacteria bacterium AqS2]|uniref:Acetolactate synthase small subunit n=1 Tax=Candidatus Amphirhobacter heronislandensis TaxID=1732024 RepID=A0A930XXK7_9GAMM|nr:acetolactate synthase small subunit [Betaproteobacteria bacterium AqS2]